MDAPSGHRQSEEIRESIRKVNIGILEGRINDLQRKQEKIEKDSASKGQDKPTSREKSLEKKIAELQERIAYEQGYPVPSLLSWNLDSLICPMKESDAEWFRPIKATKKRLCDWVN